MMFLNTPFPRHLLLVVPLMVVIAARGALGMGRIATVAVVVWSLALSVIDGAAFRSDSRGDALAWLSHRFGQETPVYADSYAARLPFHWFFPRSKAEKADVVVMHEGWYFRFRRSELTPFREPGPKELYHASPTDREMDRMFRGAGRDGGWSIMFRSAPPLILPEQFLYHRLWGNLNKFAGTTLVLERAR
jgi:hypothetical protein